MMETATMIWWRFAMRKGKLATFPGQRVSAVRVEMVATAKISVAIFLKMDIA